MIKTENISFTYPGTRNEFNFPDIQLTNNESLLILGKSGVGKTTLLHLLSGLLKPLSGTIKINGISLTSLSNKKLDQFRGKHIGILFQKLYCLSSLTPTENLRARLLFAGKKIDPIALHNTLAQLQLLEQKDHKVTQLSHGQLQRFGVALSIIHQPNLILADEPTSNLDDENCKYVINLLKEQAKLSKANLIIITHDHRVRSAFNNTISL